jgi:lysophospholipase L1-like esterase
LPLLLLTLVLSSCANPWAPGGSSQVSGHSTLDTTRYRTTYVAIGASDSFGIGTDDPDQQNWPTVLARTLGADVHLINLGVPGATVAEAQQAQLTVALDAHPDLVTVWLAVNDLADGVPLASYQQHLQALLASITQGSHARIYVGDIPDLTQLPFFAQRDPTALRTTVQQWNAAIAADCAAEGATLVDLYTGSAGLASNPEYISSDGLHPSTLGAELLAAAFAAAIQHLQAP